MVTCTLLSRLVGLRTHPVRLLDGFTGTDTWRPSHEHRVIAAPQLNSAPPVVILYAPFLSLHVFFSDFSH